MDKRIFLIVLLIGPSLASAAPVVHRWTYAQDRDANLSHIIEVLNQREQTQLEEKDFRLDEERDLAFNHYKRYVQIAEGLPIKGKSIRVWSDSSKGNALQVEAAIARKEQTEEYKDGMKSVRPISSQETRHLIFTAIKKEGSDPHLSSLRWSDEWDGGQLFRFVKAKGKRGTYLIRLNLFSGRIEKTEYREFPQGELSIPADVYPYYEEIDGVGTKLERQRKVLKYISENVLRPGNDPYAPLRTMTYLEDKMDPIKGETEEGRAQGYWSMSYVKRQAKKIQSQFPLVSNDWADGVVLQGRYATINIHPDAIKQFSGQLNFKPKDAPAFFPNWIESGETYEMVPGNAFLGRPLLSPEEALNRPATRHPQHDVLTYINEGFDDIQVYYAINELFDSLQTRGFVDPELSTRPFHAFLFNPDISSKDNAYYTDDTINFTTYSPESLNLARDNTTIWHELGHGLMDRLMGDHINLADTGGLSEGMADFVAELVVQAVSQGASFPGSDSFRIINRTGFDLTNEVHDDGEAYGGAMKDFLDLVLDRDGRVGLDKVSDLVLEAMRLGRDHPALTAKDWFERMIFADELGRPGLRLPGELRELLIRALDGRNFRFDGQKGAEFSVVRLDTNQEVTSEAPGSRQSPIKVKLPKDGSATYNLRIKLTNSDRFSFRFPVKLKIQYRGGPLQGAIHWEEEEAFPQGKEIVINSPDETVEIPVTAKGECDYSNREDGSCVDFIYLKVFNAQDQLKKQKSEQRFPVAKKRFYLKVAQE